jgi:hypothetical protein
MQKCKKCGTLEENEMRNRLGEPAWAQERWVSLSEAPRVEQLFALSRILCETFHGIVHL